MLAPTRPNRCRLTGDDLAVLIGLQNSSRAGQPNLVRQPDCSLADGPIKSI